MVIKCNRIEKRNIQKVKEFCVAKEMGNFLVEMQLIAMLKMAEVKNLL